MIAFACFLAACFAMAAAAALEPDQQMPVAEPVFLEIE